MPNKGKRRAKEIVIAVVKSAAGEARVFAGEVADATAAAAATVKAVARVTFDKVATAIEARASKGDKAAGSEIAPVAAPNMMSDTRTATVRARQPRKGIAKKHLGPKKRNSTKKPSRKASKKKRV
jgi:hypothetical protein